MRRTLWLLPPLLLAAGVVLADEVPEATGTAQAQKTPAQTAKDPAKQDPKLLEGMSILGNQEAPMLDDSRAPVDRDVFLRSLSYYEIRSETTRHDGVNRSKS